MKCLIVEGRSDKLQVAQVLTEEDVVILCTNGTISVTSLEELLAPFEMYELYTFFDADASGDKLRQIMDRVYPEAMHLNTTRLYKEVALTPLRFIAAVLSRAHFTVRTPSIEGCGIKNEGMDRRTV
ncbi:hypothetical protein GCM10007425_18330 [Lysinibacillus alkalisoli]|uniref:Toprim domain-containing protein n=1 Tax=Lysinibacillus alkalisoli TaxID=1911548 RepID=A0A917G5G0_9BACI|nr:toprim domain-containing protein [Lysinibacillus alkalisoli]GGG24200.1 hypothetical protein GCM10007425_18330 [Lysinibacillus alkalisoli]